MPIPVPVTLGQPLATGGLLSAARPLPSGWQRGVSFVDTACLSPVALGECPTMADLKPGQRPSAATFRPYSIVQAVECTSASQLDLNALSAAELDRTREVAVARELLTGEASLRDAGPSSIGNPALVHDASDLGAAYTSVVAAMADVEAAVLAANSGRGVAVLVPVPVLAHAIAAGVVWRDGARWRTPTGGLVIASPGFDGRAPGQTDPPEQGDPLYIYGVTSVWASVGERAVYQSINRAVNTDTARAEDIALAVYEPCAVFAAAATTVVAPGEPAPPEPAVPITVSVPPSAAPVATDAAGTADDRITLTYVEGVRWRVGPAGNYTYYDKNWFGGQHAKQAPWTGGGTVEVAAVPLPGYILTGTAAWLLTFTDNDGDTAVTIAVGQYPVAVDEPGTADDVVRITSVEGVIWVVGGVNYPSSGFVGTDDIPHTTGTPTTVTAVADTGYILAGTMSWNLTFTAGEPTAWDEYARFDASTLGADRALTSADSITDGGITFTVGSQGASIVAGAFALAVGATRFLMFNSAADMPAQWAYEFTVVGRPVAFRFNEAYIQRSDNYQASGLSFDGSTAKFLRHDLGLSTGQEILADAIPPHIPVSTSQTRIRAEIDRDANKITYYVDGALHAEYTGVNTIARPGISFRFSEYATHGTTYKDIVFYTPAA